ncbi:uncharacterized protein PHACADRAFT_198177 [Phanerochaete carnosa HHB-10118-sp]|uniref:Helitron helicase-like domain-containing protein n=1 Tax=Phanerochaete carnosa (strain HHB-10118-sp) TaxID=650164 RepID=K5W3Q4_PHACS|nr:uncharacterized protein PHACADRAFT_198177 [Phanerochaete carnosa HHB-10118-sp]EKM53755.1 hypothetical protein PHACADRAFT_198177 [Phanerochaete carnosa HHB-10118-sp]
MINAILRTLFSIELAFAQVKSSVGVFGHVSAYFGVVESQGRGSLHLHMLIWLKDAPTSDEMHKLLKTESFCAKVQEYICTNLRAYVPRLDTVEDIKKAENEKEIAYSQPPDPDGENYAAELVSFERRLECKRKAPFEVSEDDYVTESGTWGSK